MDFPGLKDALRERANTGGPARAIANLQEIQDTLEEFRSDLEKTLGCGATVHLEPWLSDNAATRRRLVLRRVGGSHDGFEVNACVFQIPLVGYPVEIEVGKETYRADDQNELRDALQNRVVKTPLFLDLVSELLSLA